MRWPDIAAIGCKLPTFSLPPPVSNLMGKSEEENQNESSVEVVNRTSSVTSKRKKRRGLVLLQLFIVAGFLATVWFSFGQNVLAPQKQPRVPERLGDLQLVGTIEGSEAMARIGRLHGTDINLASAYIVEYVHGTERGTVWVGITENSKTNQ